jgi:hypothetical protein
VFELNQIADLERSCVMDVLQPEKTSLLNEYFFFATVRRPVGLGIILLQCITFNFKAPFMLSFISLILLLRFFATSLA